jgi:glycosyltransferase involved in cell wall biosynthesis
LIYAFAKLRSKRSVRLIILGEGELREELGDIINRLSLNKDVDLHGFVDNPFSFMRHSDLFILSSAWEGLPGALIQAMACGVPVVATDCRSGPAEILENGKWGRLVPVGDVTALAEAIADALDAEHHPDVESRAAEFGMKQALDGYLQVLIGEIAPAGK